MRHHILLFTLMVLLAVLPIAGCGANEEGGTSGETLQETGGTGGAQSDNEETPESKTEADTRVVTHAKGEIEVPANPEKIAVISDMGWEDNLLAMGAKPYIASTFSWVGHRILSSRVRSAGRCTWRGQLCSQYGKTAGTRSRSYHHQRSG